MSENVIIFKLIQFHFVNFGMHYLQTVLNTLVKAISSKTGDCT